MSYFGNRDRDEIADNIKTYADSQEKPVSEIIEDIMEIVTYALKIVVEDFDEKLKSV